MLGNFPDTFTPLELSTPPEFDGVPRKLIAAPTGFFCPCCPIELARPMLQMRQALGADDNPLAFKVHFQCIDCKAILVTKRVPGIRRYKGGLNLPPA